MIDDIFAPLTGLVATNQRKSIRYDQGSLMAHLTLKRRFKSDEYTFAKVIDISSSGAYISTAHQLPVKTIITLNVTLNNQFIYKVTAKVTRSAANTHYGICFNKKQHVLIDQIIAHNNSFSIS